MVEAGPITTSAPAPSRSQELPSSEISFPPLEPFCRRTSKGLCFVAVVEFWASLLALSRRVQLFFVCDFLSRTCACTIIHLVWYDHVPCVLFWPTCGFPETGAVTAAMYTAHTVSRVMPDCDVFDSPYHHHGRTTDAHLDLTGASSNSYYVGSISVAERSVVVYPMNLVCAAQPVVSVLCHQVGAARILALRSRG